MVGKAANPKEMTCSSERQEREEEPEECIRQQHRLGLNGKKCFEKRPTKIAN